MILWLGLKYRFKKVNKVITRNVGKKGIQLLGWFLVYKINQQFREIKGK